MLRSIENTSYSAHRAISGERVRARARGRPAKSTPNTSADLPRIGPALASRAGLRYLAYDLSGCPSFAVFAKVGNKGVQRSHSKLSCSSNSRLRVRSEPSLLID